MSLAFKELDYQHTAIGAISLRQRHDPVLNDDVFEIKLDDEFLMSSAFTASEVALARHGLAAVAVPSPNVVVGGLGLGYTAHEVLRDERVTSLLVVELLEPVIEWHRRGLLPVSADLNNDPRCVFSCNDFFAAATSEHGFDMSAPGRRYDAILLDIDHAPGAVLDPRSAQFYQPQGLAALARHLQPGGVFGLWSNDPPDDDVTATLATVFASAWAEPVTFDNPYQDRVATQSVYFAKTAA